MKMPSFFTLVLILIAFFGFIISTQAIVSDDFNSPQLNTDLWTFVDPLTDSNISMTGDHISIYVPAEVSHDIWNYGDGIINKAPRIMQPADDNDFQIEVGFDSPLIEQYQMQGIIAQQDDANFIRFDFYSDGTSVNLFTAIFNNGNTTTKVNKTISESQNYYLKVSRTIDLWTLYYSYNGNDWTIATSFNHKLNINSIGLFGANHGSGTDVPEFNCLVDYFTASAPQKTDINTPSSGNCVWRHVSSQTGQISAPPVNTGQAALQVFDIDKDTADDFVIAAWGTPNSVTWYQKIENNWSQYVLETDTLTLEAGGTHYDIDGDGDIDLVFGGGHTDNRIFWWENPYPDFEPNTPWVRRLIKNSGANKHHDMLFCDFDNDGQTEFISFNQYASQLLMFEIPDNPKTSGTWTSSVIYSWEGAEREGLAASDIDLDGDTDLVGAGKWFEYISANNVSAHTIDDAMYFVRADVGQLVPGGRPEVLFGPGDSRGTLKMYQWNGSSWLPSTIKENVEHGHSLSIADFDGNCDLDILVGEMGQWSSPESAADNPDAIVSIFYGDGTGTFTEQVISIGIGVHEAKPANADSDGDIDIISKPFRHNIPSADVWLNEGLRLSLQDWQRHVIEPDLGWQVLFIDAKDLDNDNLKDIITGGWWYKNPGTTEGQWMRNEFGSGLKNMAAVFDFDNDEKLDVLGTSGEGSQDNPNFVWAHNQGEGTFNILNNIPAGGGTFLQGAATGRFSVNDTGTIEIALSWHNGGAVQMLTVPQNPLNDTWTISDISSIGLGEALTKGDIDTDGDSDILLGTKWLRNDNTTWTLQTVSNVTGEPDRNRLADINGDGKLDAVIGFEAVSATEKLAWYEQPNDLNDLWNEHIVDNIIGPMSLDAVDMDSDGDVDIVVGEHNTADPSSAVLFVYENTDGIGDLFVKHIVYIGDEHHDGALAVDIDNDGDMDIVSIGWVNDKVVLYENLTSRPPKGDIKVDCRIDRQDLLLFTANWLGYDCAPPGWCTRADIDMDNNVDFEDFSMMADNWLQCYNYGCQ